MLETVSPLTCAPSREDPRDWVFEPENQALAAPPAAVDLRDAPGAFPPPWDQAQLNSCTAQAMAAALHFDARRQEPGTDFVPSRLFIYYNERKDEGTLGQDRVHGRPVQMRDCIRAVAEVGACTEAAWPDDAAKLDVAPPAAAYAEAGQRLASSYHRLEPDLAHLKACLAQGFPFVFGVRVYASFPGYGSQGRADVPLPAPGEGLLGGHALLAVGYDDARGAFIVRNSWGEAWGDGGYGYFPYAYLTDPALAFDHWVVNALAAAAASAEAIPSAAAADVQPAAVPAPPASVPAVAIYPPTPTPAPTAEGDAGTAAAPEQLNAAWSSNGYGELDALVLAGDRLLGLTGGYLYALDIYHGTAVGTSDQVPAQGFPYPVQSPGSNVLAAAGGVVYLTDTPKGSSNPQLQLLAFGVADGQPVAGWTPPALTGVSALLTPPGQLVAISSDPSGATLATGFDAVSGAVVWPRGATGAAPTCTGVTLSAQTPGPVACGPDAAFFMAGTSLQAVNLDFGDTRWSFTNTAGGELDATWPAAVGAQVVLATSTLVHGVDLQLGGERWTVAPQQGGPQVAWQCAVDETGTIGVAASSGGEVVGITLATGAVAWRTLATQPTAPVVAAGVVSVITGGGSVLTRLELATGAPLPSYTLPNLAGGQLPLVGNATLFIPAGDGSIAAQPFGDQCAAYFDGVAANVDITPDGNQFDFGTGDFTVEAWVKTTEGGEVVSSYPTSGKAGDCGFRLNLTSRGEVRVAVVDPVGQTSNRGQTAPTAVADGSWHHLALLRRGGSFVVLVDGLSLPVRLPAAPGDPLSLGGTSGLTIGAYAPAPAKTHFHGLIREVRVWDRALDVSTVQGNAKVELTGTEPRLQGLWRLDEVQAPGAVVEPRNAVQRHRATAVFTNPASFPTDLEMDDSAFPYLLHESQEQWPYAGSWAARGEQALSTPPALCAGTLAFGTDNAVYGVRAADGLRLWQLPVAEGASAPVAGTRVFYLLTGEESLVAVDAVTGAKQQVAAFAGLLAGDTGPFAAPAVSPRYLAAASPAGSVAVLDRSAGAAGAAVTATPPVSGTPQALAFGPFGLAVLSGSAPQWTVTIVDPATGAAGTGIPVGSAVFCVAGSWLACVKGGALVRIDPTTPATALATGSVAASTLTGLAAAPDADLLVATTSTGTVFGLSLATLAQRWATPLPAAAGAASTPTFDAAGRVFCGTAGGAMVVLDPASGGVLGMWEGPNAVITPALVDAGTAYFGCLDPSDPAADLDGALHSVVFGETVALRLNLDVLGAPVAATAACAVVDAEDAAATLRLLDVTQSCVEAWINLPVPAPTAARQPGGGVLGICPTFDSVSRTGGGLSLSLGPDGTLHYTALTAVAGAWTRLDAQAPATVCDGLWHHLAVSRGGDAGSLVFYVDGLALPPVTPTTTPVSAPATLTGLKAYLGAVANPAFNPVSPFCGMIAEVRVWDTYLVSTDIATRMHVKLRGDEPDLLAYWNFDRLAVHDAALQGSDGALAGAGADPTWWLTDLPFTSPAYPWMESAAAITHVGEAGAAESLAEETYALTLTVHRADGSCLAGHPLDLYYVLHAADDPPTVTIAGTEVTGVMLGDESAPVDGGSVSVVTGPNGAVTVQVATTLLGHGPAIDVHAGFMPANERFHVSTLIDNQKLAKPAPPVLTAQAKLIQDYHYTAGNAVDDTRSRATWRVVVRAANADQTSRAGESVTLWTSVPAAIEAGGASYPVTADNSVTLSADGRGELAVVLAASDLTAPTLYARAGFMHRDDQVVVKPDQDAHAQLGAVTGSDLTTPRPTNWKPNSTPADNKALLTGDYAPHAGDVASAVGKVMAVSGGGSSSGSSSTAGGAGGSPGLGLGVGDGAAAVPAGIDFMRQPPPPAATDQIAVLRTVRRAPRRLPANVDAFRAALGGSAGLVFDTSGGAGTLRFALLPTLALVAAETAGAATAAPALGGFFSDLWDDVETAADDIYAAAQKLVIAIDNEITLAITTLVNDVESVVNVVVDSVEKAVAAVVGFFKQLLVDIMDVINFLLALFDWDAILRTHRIVKDTMMACAQVAAAQMGDGDSIRAAVSGLVGWTGAALAPPPGGNLADLGGGAPAAPPGVSSMAGVKGKMMTQKAQDHPPTGGGPTAAPAPLAAPASPSAALQGVLGQIPGLASTLLTTPPGDLFAQLDAMLKDVLPGLEDEIATALVTAAADAGDALVGMLESLDTPIDIPFISALYHWITGDDLSLLDLFALVLAVPLNVAYVVVTTLQGATREFPDDNSGLAAAVLQAGGLPAGTALGLAAATPAGEMALGDGIAGLPEWGAELVYVSFQLGYTIFSGLSDAAFTAAMPEEGSLKEYDPSLDPSRAPWKILGSVCGIGAGVMMAWWILPRVKQRLDDTVKDPALRASYDRYFGVTQVGGFIASLVANLATLYSGGKTWDTEAEPFTKPTDQAAEVALGFVAVLSLAQIGYGIWDIAENSLGTSTSSGVGLEITLMHVRDMFYALPRTNGFLFTHAGSLQMPVQDFFAFLTASRTMENLMGLTFHCVAAFSTGADLD